MALTKRQKQLLDFLAEFIETSLAEFQVTKQRIRLCQLRVVIVEQGLRRIHFLAERGRGHAIAQVQLGSMRAAQL